MGFLDKLLKKDDGDSQELVMVTATLFTKMPIDEIEEKINITMEGIPTNTKDIVWHVDSKESSSSIRNGVKQDYLIYRRHGYIKRGVFSKPELATELEIYEANGGNTLTGEFDDQTAEFTVYPFQGDLNKVEVRINCVKSNDVYETVKKAIAGVTEKDAQELAKQQQARRAEEVKAELGGATAEDLSSLDVIDFLNEFNNKANEFASDVSIKNFSKVKACYDEFVKRFNEMSPTERSKVAMFNSGLSGMINALAMHINNEAMFRALAPQMATNISTTILNILNALS